MLRRGRARSRLLGPKFSSEFCHYGASLTINVAPLVLKSSKTTLENKFWFVKRSIPLQQQHPLNTGNNLASESLKNPSHLDFMLENGRNVRTCRWCSVVLESGGVSGVRA